MFSRHLIPKSHLAIVVSEFRKEITLKLLNKCQETLLEHGVREKYLDTFWVPGAFEIPLKTQELAQSKKYKVIIALGCIIKGDTLHFELVAKECARGIMQVILQEKTPIVFEVLACLKMKDAQDRSKNNEENRGHEAALTALKLLG